MKAASVLTILCLWASANARKTGREDSGLSVRVKEYCYNQFPPACDISKYADWYRVGSYCLKYFNTPLNFSDAEFFCRNAVPGGHLVSVHSQQANTDLLCIIMKHNASHPRIWTGGMELFQSNKFIWIDGSRWEYQNWVPGQPDNTRNNEDCVEMNWSHTGKWNDDTCRNEKAVVCSFKNRV